MVIKPLAGCTIIVTRATHQASHMCKQLRQLGATPLELPTIEIREIQNWQMVDQEIQNIQNYDWLLLTSVNGVEILWQRCTQLGLTPKTHFQNTAIGAIGPQTAESIQAQGLKVALMPPEFVAESLSHSLIEQGVQGKKILTLRADIARNTLVHDLENQGAKVTNLAIYETHLPNIKADHPALVAIQKGQADVITFTSSSTVRHFKQILGDIALPGHIKVASIGPITSATARQYLGRVDIEATEYTIPGLIDAIAADWG